MFKMAFLTAAILIGAGLATTASADDPPAGFLGQPLAEVLKSGFFNWFNLVETATKPNADGGRTVSYKPSGPRFHQLTTVAATVDSSGVVRRIDLVLLRSFIDSPKDMPFASDIAKSFLGDAPPAPDASELKTLTAEIEYRPQSSGTVIVGPGYKKPDLPETSSAGYETYAGARPSYRQMLGHSELAMTNEKSSDGDALRIAFTEK